MFKNTVLKASVDTVTWLRNTVVRMARSAAIAALALIPTTGATLGNVDWKLIGSAAAAQAIITGLICIAGIPECPAKED